MEEQLNRLLLEDSVRQALEETLCLAQITSLNGNIQKLEGLITAAIFIAQALGTSCPESMLRKLAEMEMLLQQQDEDSGWVI